MNVTNEALTGRKGRHRDLHRTATGVFLQVCNSAKSNKGVLSIFLKHL